MESTWTSQGCGAMQERGRAARSTGTGIESGVVRKSDQRRGANTDCEWQCNRAGDWAGAKERRGPGDGVIKIVVKYDDEAFDD